MDEVVSFAQALVEDTDVLVSGEDGLEDMVAALAAGKSLKEGKPVTIAEMKKELGL